MYRIGQRILFLCIACVAPMHLQAMWRSIGKRLGSLTTFGFVQCGNYSTDKKIVETVLADFMAQRVKSYQLEQHILTTIYGGNSLYEKQAIDMALHVRRTALLQKYNLSVKKIAGHSIATMCNGVPNIENQLGGTVYPLCDAGMLKINGQYAKGIYPIWPTTHESALPAGIKRGSKVINMVGGVQTVVTHANMTRAPLVETPSIHAAKSMVDTINNDKQLFNIMAGIVKMKSTVTKLIGVKALQDGRDVHIRLVFDTGDCMGMNSATLYGGYILEGLKYYFSDIKLIALSGNLCSDKKQTHANIWEGRGVGVEAEVEIPASILKKVYKNVVPATIADINTKKNLRGSALAGTLGGFNANAANAIAALFLSTGQDAAQLTESTAAFTRASVDKGGNLVMGVKLPCLEIAAIGGGVGTETSREYLEILGCYGPGTHPGDNKARLGEIIAGAVLAQELNLLATLANNYELAESHVLLSRGRISNVSKEISQYITAMADQAPDLRGRDEDKD